MNEEKPIPKSVRRYFAKIGRKGGKSGRGMEWRRNVCRHAATVRWRAYREAKQAEADKVESEIPTPPLDSQPVMHDIPA